jgi:hypothetical protein
MGDANKKLGKAIAKKVFEMLTSADPNIVIN